MADYWLLFSSLLFPVKAEALREKKKKSHSSFLNLSVSKLRLKTILISTVMPSTLNFISQASNLLSNKSYEL